MGLDFDVTTLYHGLQSIKSLNSKLTELSTVLDNLDISGVELSTAGLLSNARNIVHGIIDDTVNDISQRLEKIKNIIIENDADMEFLFTMLDGKFSDEFGNIDEELVMNHLQENKDLSYYQEFLNNEDSRLSFLLGTVLDQYGYKSLQEIASSRNEELNKIQDLQKEKNKYDFSNEKVTLEFFNLINNKYKGVCSNFDGIANNETLAYKYVDSTGSEIITYSYDSIPDSYKGDAKGLTYNDLSGDSAIYNEVKNNMERNWFFTLGLSSKSKDLNDKIYAQIEKDNAKLEDINASIDASRNRISELNIVENNVLTETNSLNIKYGYELREDFDANSKNIDAENIANSVSKFKENANYRSFNFNPDATGINIEHKYVKVNDEKDKLNIIYSLISDNGQFQVFDDKVSYVDKNGDIIYVTDDDGMLSNFALWASELDEDEKKCFYYNWNTGGVDDTYKYLSDVSSELDMRWVARRTLEDQEFATANPGQASLASVLLNPIEGLDAFVYSTKQRFNNQKMVSSQLYAHGDTMRAKVSTDIANSGKKYATANAFMYNVSMSIADNMYSIALTGGNSVASGIILGAGGFDNNMNDALSRGLTDEDAFNYSLSMSAVEAVTEAVSIDNLLKLQPLGNTMIKNVGNFLDASDDALASVIKNADNVFDNLKKVNDWEKNTFNNFILNLDDITDPKYRKIVNDGVNLLYGSVSQGTGEGMEELASSIMGEWVDKYFAGDNSTFNLSVENYINYGYTEAEAIALTQQQQIEEFAMSYLSGLTSGSISGGGKLAGSIAIGDVSSYVSNMIDKYKNPNYDVVNATISENIRNRKFEDAIEFIMNQEGKTNTEKAIYATSLINVLSIEDNRMISENMQQKLTDMVSEYVKSHSDAKIVDEPVLVETDNIENQENNVMASEPKVFKTATDIALYFGDSNLYLQSLLIKKRANKEINYTLSEMLDLKAQLYRGESSAIDKVKSLLNKEELNLYNKMLSDDGVSIQGMWISKLDDLEKTSLRIYAQTFDSISAYEALDYYGYVSKDNSYVSITELMRAGYENGKELIDSAIEKFGVLPNEIVTYRGVGLDALSSQFGEIDVENLGTLIGKVYRDKAYMSSSLLESKAYAALGKPTDVILKLTVPTDANYGAYIEKLAGVNYGQLEFLIKKNSTSLIENAYVNEDGKIVVKMRLFEEGVSDLSDTIQDVSSDSQESSDLVEDNLENFDDTFSWDDAWFSEEDVWGNLSEVDDNQKDWSVDVFLESNNIDLETGDTSKLLYNIKWLTLEQKDTVLADSRVKESIKNYILEGEQSWAFYDGVFKNVDFVQLKDVFDFDFVERFFADSLRNNKYIFFSSAFSNANDRNQVMDIILENQSLFDAFKNIHDKFSSAVILDSEHYKKLISKIEQTDSFDNFTQLSIPVDIFSDLINADYSVKTLSWLINLVVGSDQYRSIISDFYTNDSRAVSTLPYIKKYLDSFLKYGIKFGNSVIYSPEFFEMLKSDSILEFREQVNWAETSCDDPDYIEGKVKQYYEELILENKNERELYKKYDEILDTSETDAVIEQRLKEIEIPITRENDLRRYVSFKSNMLQRNSQKLSEIIADGLFQDSIYNVWININELLKYDSYLSENEKILTKEKHDFYESILKIDSYSTEKRIELYNKLKDQNINLMFYEDMRATKDLAYKKIKDKMISLTEHPEYISEVESEKNGVTTYDLRSAEYYMLIRNLKALYDEYGANNGGSSYSLISNNNTDAFGHGHGIIYGYNSFDIDKVEHMFESDSHSLSTVSSRGTSSNASDRPNRLSTVEEIADSAGYSEIVLKNHVVDGKGIHEMTPDFVVAINEADASSIKVSKELGLPMVIIKEGNNPTGGFNFVDETEEYVRGEYVEYKRIAKRNQVNGQVVNNEDMPLPFKIDNDGNNGAIVFDSQEVDNVVVGENDIPLTTDITVEEDSVIVDANVGLTEEVISEEEKADAVDEEKNVEDADDSSWVESEDLGIDNRTKFIEKYSNIGFNFDISALQQDILQSGVSLDDVFRIDGISSRFSGERFIDLFSEMSIGDVSKIIFDEKNYDFVKSKVPFINFYINLVNQSQSLEQAISILEKFDTKLLGSVIDDMSFKFSLNDIVANTNNKDFLVNIMKNVSIGDVLKLFKDMSCENIEYVIKNVQSFSILKTKYDFYSRICSELGMVGDKNSLLSFISDNANSYRFDYNNNELTRLLNLKYANIDLYKAENIEVLKKDILDSDLSLTYFMELSSIPKVGMGSAICSNLFESMSQEEFLTFVNNFYNNSWIDFAVRHQNVENLIYVLDCFSDSYFDFNFSRRVVTYICSSLSLEQIDSMFTNNSFKLMNAEYRSAIIQKLCDKFGNNILFSAIENGIIDFSSLTSLDLSLNQNNPMTMQYLLDILSDETQMAYLIDAVKMDYDQDVISTYKENLFGVVRLFAEFSVRGYNLKFSNGIVSDFYRLYNSLYLSNTREDITRFIDTYSLDKSKISIISDSQFYSHSDGKVGVSQHSIVDVFNPSKLSTAEGIRLKNLLVNQMKRSFPGMSTKFAIEFLKKTDIGENVGGTGGICNYADVCNAIFEYFHKKGYEAFERTFGFPMYLDGHLNDAQLLLDMFINIAGREMLVKNGKIFGNRYNLNGEMGNYANLATTIEESHIYRGDYIKGYLEARGIMNSSDCVVQRMLYHSKYSNYTEKNYFGSNTLQLSTEFVANDILIKIHKALKNSEHLSIAAWKGLRMEQEDGGIHNLKNGHIMSIYGIDNNGDLLVDSWGKTYKINLKQTLDDGINFVIGGLDLNAIGKVNTSNYPNDKIQDRTNRNELNSYDIDKTNGVSSEIDSVGTLSDDGVREVYSDVLQMHDKILQETDFSRLGLLEKQEVADFFGKDVSEITEQDYMRFKEIIRSSKLIFKNISSDFKITRDLLFGAYDKQLTDVGYKPDISKIRKMIAVARNNPNGLVNVIKNKSQGNIEILKAIGLYNIIDALNQVAVMNVGNNISQETEFIKLLAAKNPDFFVGAKEKIEFILKEYMDSAKKNNHVISKELENVAKINGGNVKGDTQKENGIIPHSLKTLDSAVRKIYGDFLDKLREQGFVFDGVLENGDVKLKGINDSNRDESFVLTSEGNILKKNDYVAGKFDDNVVYKINYSDFIPKDLLRYTIIFNNDNYVSSFINTIKDLENAKYKIIKANFSWPGKHYQGINITFEKDSQIFELQFHTEESFYAKDDATHTFYEIKRNNELEENIRDVADYAQKLIQSQVSIPKDAEKISKISKFIKVAVEQQRVFSLNDYKIFEGSLTFDDFNDSDMYLEKLNKFITSLDDANGEVKLSEFLKDYFGIVPNAESGLIHATQISTIDVPDENATSFTVSDIISNEDLVVDEFRQAYERLISSTDMKIQEMLNIGFSLDYILSNSSIQEIIPNVEVYQKLFSNISNEKLMEIILDEKNSFIVRELLTLRYNVNFYIDLLSNAKTLEYANFILSKINSNYYSSVVENLELYGDPFLQSLKHSLNNKAMDESLLIDLMNKLVSCFTNGKIKAYSVYNGVYTDYIDIDCMELLSIVINDYKYVEFLGTKLRVDEKNYYQYLNAFCSLKNAMISLGLDTKVSSVVVERLNRLEIEYRSDISQMEVEVEYLKNSISTRKYSSYNIGGIKYNIPSNIDKSKQNLTVLDINKIISAMPVKLRKSIKEVNIYDTKNPFDPMWAVSYNTADFVSAGTGGSGQINIYSPSSIKDRTSTFFGRILGKDISDSTFKTVYHEAGHCFDDSLGNISYSFEWNEAIIKDGEFPSYYCSTNNREDFAESIAFYNLNRDWFVQNFPNRAKILERILN